MSKKKKSSKKSAKLEKVLLATAIIELIQTILDIIKKLLE